MSPFKAVECLGGNVVVSGKIQILCEIHLDLLANNDAKRNRNG